MINRRTARLSVRRHYSSEDIMFLLAEGKNSTCSRLDPLLPFIFKVHYMKARIMSY